MGAIESSFSLHFMIVSFDHATFGKIMTGFGSCLIVCPFSLVRLPLNSKGTTFTVFWLQLVSFGKIFLSRSASMNFHMVLLKHLDFHHIHIY